MYWSTYNVYVPFKDCHWTTHCDLVFIWTNQVFDNSDSPEYLIELVLWLDLFLMKSISSQRKYTNVKNSKLYILSSRKSSATKHVPFKTCIWHINCQVFFFTKICIFSRTCFVTLKLSFDQQIIRNNIWQYGIVNIWLLIKILIILIP